MYRKPMGPHIGISLKELIASMMVSEDRTSFRTGEIYDKYLDVTYKMKQHNINGTVFYSRTHLQELKYEEANLFECGIGYISLKDGYNIDWLQENIVSHMSRSKLQILGLLGNEKTYSR